MIDKENKNTLGKKTHEGKILIYCGGNIRGAGTGGAEGAAAPPVFFCGQL